MSMSSSSVSSTTTRTTQATRKQLKPADSRQTCHSAALRPQHGFSQFDLTGGEDGGGLRDREGKEMCSEEQQTLFCIQIQIMFSVKFDGKHK